MASTGHGANSCVRYWRSQPDERWRRVDAILSEVLGWAAIAVAAVVLVGMAIYGAINGWSSLF